ncbi:MAG TPA: Flp pilus assembly protein CpaB [Steroidobacteraceae bacterium]|nr:Flp pilus assembly protein CpaB [Steroidobacteraceae bacterium]
MKFALKLPLKLPQLNRNWLTLVGAVFLGLVAMGLAVKLQRDHMAKLDAEARAGHKLVAVVVAKQDLPKGFRIVPGAFAVREIPSEYVHSSAITPKILQQYLGQKLGAPIKGGEALLRVHLESITAVFSSTLPSGNRALTTEVDEVNSISGLLRPQDHIDLMATAPDQKSGEITFPLLTNVEVLATGQTTRKADGTNQARVYTTITMSVSPEDAQRVVVAKSSGRLTAVLRNPDDQQGSSISAMNIHDLLPKKPQAPHHVAVQYIIGGGSRS